MVQQQWFNNKRLYPQGCRNPNFHLHRQIISLMVPCRCSLEYDPSSWERLRFHGISSALNWARLPAASARPLGNSYGLHGIIDVLNLSLLPAANACPLVNTYCSSVSLVSSIGPFSQQAAHALLGRNSGSTVSWVSSTAPFCHQKAQALHTIEILSLTLQYGVQTIMIMQLGMMHYSFHVDLICDYTKVIRPN